MAKEICMDESSAFYGMRRDSVSTKQHFNAVEHTHNVMGAAQTLSGRVLGLVSKLMGPQLEESGTDSRPKHGPGILPNLHDVSEETGHAIRKANEALDRLEKELA